MKGHAFCNDYSATIGRVLYGCKCGAVYGSQFALRQIDAKEAHRRHLATYANAAGMPRRTP